MSVRVGRRGELGAVYIGRPSPLGNPFVMKSEAQRTEVIAKYRALFEQYITWQTPKIMQELEYLEKLARRGDLVLGCFCAPRACHGDVIKEYLDRKLAEPKE